MAPNEVKIGGIYRHYKGGLYRVTGIVKHTETEEVLVTYRAVMYSHDLTTWARPIGMFCEEVGGKPRFSLLQLEV